MNDLTPILIAEDSDDDFFFFRRALRAAQVENPVLRFRDGSELIRFLESLPPEDYASAGPPWLLFVDLTMPIMNGFDVLQWLMSWKHAEKMRAIVLSGSHREDDVKRSLGLGAIDHLVKPISPAVLGAIVMDTAKPAHA